MVKITVPLCLKAVFVAICDEADTPLSARAKDLIVREEYDQLIRLRTDPRDYTEAEVYFRDTVICDFFRKCSDLPVKVDAELEGFKVWVAAEKQCYHTNHRFQKHLLNGPFEDPEDLRIHEVLLRVRDVFRGVMGSVPQEIEGRHGPGATIGNPRKRSTIPDKMTVRPTVSAGARAFLPFWGKTLWARSLMQEHSYHSEPKTETEGRLSFVVKTAAVSRGIDSGPSINIFYQLGVGGVFRPRLKKHGIDLDHGQSAHKQVACAASIDGVFATEDTRSASDTVAYSVVEFLATESWFAVLDALRVPKTRYGKKVYHLEKFSAMGNGYTFELETMIFFAIAFVAIELSGIVPKLEGKERNLWVYGDDVILPVQASRTFDAMMSYFGFLPNLEKSFSTGPFRESCGGDYFNGVPVRAHFVGEYPSNPADWISLANGIRRMSTVDGVAFAREWLRKPWFKCLDQIPSDIRKCRGPEWLGDIVIHDDETKWTKLKKLVHNVEPSKDDDEVNVTEYVRVWQGRQRPLSWKYFKSSVKLASALLGVDSNGPIERDSAIEFSLSEVPLIRSGWLPH